jgi:hypothetical protein
MTAAVIERYRAFIASKGTAADSDGFQPNHHWDLFRHQLAALRSA